MAEPIKCFLLVPTNFYRQELRRYNSEWKGSEHLNPCSLPHGYHDASRVINESLELAEQPVSGRDDIPHDDPRWPKNCACGWFFKETDVWQVFYQQLFQRSDSGERVILRDAPSGAIWDASWFPDSAKRADGHRYICRTPGGEWDIDGRCSNCTRPNELHECWVRHGEAPNLHVDKVGNTCAAGAGSVITGGWHGFLHNGYLVEC